MANRAAAQGWSLSAEIGLEGARGGPWMAQRATIVRRPAERTASAAEASGEERIGERGGREEATSKRTLIEWLQDRLDD